MLVSGVPKLNKVDICEAVRITLYTTIFEILPLKKLSEPDEPTDAIPDPIVNH